nr:hypothetical protein [uncultured Desulfuromonas sp.]
MTSDLDQYTTCDGCGKSILVKCAIEDDGRILCGDCVVQKTDKEVKNVEELLEKERKEKYAQEKDLIVKKQRLRAVIVLIACLAVFALVQFFNQLNKPEPVSSTQIDLQSNPETLRTMITFALHDYKNDHQGKVPNSLTELTPNYLQMEIKPFLTEFIYKKTGETTFQISEKTVSTEGENKDDGN